MVIAHWLMSKNMLVENNHMDYEHLRDLEIPWDDFLTAHVLPIL